MKKILLFFLSVFCFTNLLAQELIPTETDALLNVLVTNKNGTPRGGEVILFRGLSTKKLFKTITGADGKSVVTGTDVQPAKHTINKLAKYFISFPQWVYSVLPHCACLQ